MLQLTEFAAPDPVAHYLGRRPLEVDLRDVRGRLVEQDQAVPLPASSRRWVRRPGGVPPILCRGGGR